MTKASITASGFTLVELLVSLVVITLTMGILLQLTNATQRVWLDGRAKTSQFREARAGYEAITRQISQATLNTYWDYDNPALPTKYIRQSDLHFVTGPTSALLSTNIPTPTHGIFFQAPLGLVEQTSNEQLDDVLNCWGYYLAYDSDLTQRPDFLTDGKRVKERVRYRLMEFRQPSEEFQVFARNLRTSTSKAPADYYRWFAGNASPEFVKRSSQPLADNIVALVISPRLPLPKKGGAIDPEEYQRIAPNYSYDSREFQWSSSTGDRVMLTRNQLPPTALVTMVAIDETSAQRLADRGKADNLVDSTWFQNAQNYDTDIDALETRFSDLRINYRVFTSTVTMRNSKWSE